MSEIDVKLGKTDDGFESFEINNASGLIRGCYYDKEPVMPRLNIHVLMCSEMDTITRWFKVLSEKFNTRIIAFMNYCLGDPFFIMPDFDPRDYFDDPCVVSLDRDGETVYNIIGKIKERE